MTSYTVASLPDEALEAASRFHAAELPKIRAALGGLQASAPGHLAILFPPAAHDHRGWRLAVVQDLARAAAPARVNGVVGSDRQAIEEALVYLEAAPGVTGQVLAVDGKSGESG